MNGRDKHLHGRYARNWLMQQKTIWVTKLKTVFEESSLLNLCIGDASVLLEVPFMLLKQRCAFIR